MEQRTPEWIRWRQGGIGGSDVAAILGLSPWRSRFDCWLDKTGQSEPIVVTPAMQRGIDLEEEARTAYEAYTKLIVQPLVMEDPDWPIARASLDGLTFDGVLAAEFKCPGTAAHLNILRSMRVPEHYLPQCFHTLMVSKAERLHFWSYHPDHPPALITVDPDVEYIKWMLTQEQAFWRQVTGEDAPPTAPGSDYRLDTNWLETARLFREAEAGMSEWEAKKAAARERLITLMGQTTHSTGGGVTVTKLSKTTTAYAQAAKDAGLALEKYQTTRAEWRVNIAKEAK